MRASNLLGGFHGLIFVSCKGNEIFPSQLFSTDYIFGNFAPSRVFRNFAAENQKKWLRMEPYRSNLIHGWLNMGSINEFSWKVAFPFCLDVYTSIAPYHFVSHRINVFLYVPPCETKTYDTIAVKPSQENY